MAQPVRVGTDVSGKWLDIGTYPRQQTMRFAYADAGVMDLLCDRIPKCLQLRHAGSC